MSIQEGQLTKCEWIPHNDVTLLSTRSHKSVLWGVDEWVDTLLMQVKSFVRSIIKSFNIMNMDEAVKRRRNDISKIWVVFYFCDPTLVNLSYDWLVNIFLHLIVTNWFLFNSLNVFRFLIFLLILIRISCVFTFHALILFLIFLEVSSLSLFILSELIVFCLNLSFKLLFDL